MTTIQQIFKEGSEAFEKGLSLTDNPYSEGYDHNRDYYSDEWLVWNYGFLNSFYFKYKNLVIEEERPEVLR